MYMSWRTQVMTPRRPGTIFEFTPDGERIVFGSVPGVPDNITANFGLAFDSTGNLYATATGAQTIYKFAPNGARTVFVGPSAFATGAYSAGLAFDSSGNLFVSIETLTNPGANSIIYFTLSGVGTTFATGLTTLGAWPLTARAIFLWLSAQTATRRTAKS